MHFEFVLLLSILPCVLSIEQDEQGVFSSLSHDIDMAALNLMKQHNSVQHSSAEPSSVQHATASSRQRRNTYDKFQHTVDYTQAVGERQKLIINRVVPEQLLKQTHPHDIEVFSLHNKELSKHSSFSGRQLYLAIAENYHGHKNYSSNVNIFKFSESNAKFGFEFAIPVHAPHRLEFFAAATNSAGGSAVKSFLAIGGFIERDVMMHNPPKTFLSIYLIDESFSANNYTRVFHKPMSVAALSNMHVAGETLLLVAERKSAFTSFLTVLKYDARLDKFSMKTRFPVSSITDIETVEIGGIAYVILSVYEDYFGRLTANSLVLKYDAKHQSFSVHRKFQTTGALDIEVFTPSASPYVITSNEAVGLSTSRNYGKARSYMYNVDKDFKMKRVATIATTGAKQASSITLPHCHNKQLILGIDSKDSMDQITMYTFDDVKKSLKKIPVAFYHGVPTKFRAHPRRIASFLVGPRVFVVLANDNPSATNVFSIDYEMQESSSPSDKFFAHVEKTLNQITTVLTITEKFLADAERIIRNAVYKNGNQSIFGRKVFENGLHVDNATITELDTVNGSIYHEVDGEDGASKRSRADPRRFQNNITVDELERKFAELNVNVNRSSKQLQTVYFINRPANVTGEKYFDTANFQQATFTAENANVDYANGIDMDALLRDVVQQGADDVIFGSKSFYDDVTIHGDLITRGLVNEVDISKNVVTVKGDQVVEASKTMSSNVGFNRSVFLSGTVNEVDIGSEAVFLNANVTLQGEKTFADDAIVKASKVTIAAYLDEVNINELEQDSMKLNGHQFLTGLKTFASSVTSHGDVEVGGLVNGIVDLQEFSGAIYRLDTTAMAAKKSCENWPKGRFTFLDPMFVGEDLKFAGKFNRLAFPGDVALVSESQTVTGEKRFAGEITVLGNVDCRGLVGGKNTTKFVTLSGKQTLTGKKILIGDSFEPAENITVENEGVKVNGVHVSTLAARTMRVSTGRNITGRMDLTEATFKNSLVIEGNVDDVTFSYYKDLYKNALLNTGDQVIAGGMLFKESITLQGNLTVVGNVNGYSVPYDFLMTSLQQNITGRYRFNWKVKFASDVTVHGFVSEIDLNRLAKRVVFTDSDQNVSGLKVFHSSQKFGDIVIFGKINGAHMHELMTKNTAQIVTAPKTFDAATIQGDLTVKADVKVQRTVNGVDLSELKNSVVYKDNDDVRIKGRMQFHGDVKVKRVQAEIINGVNITEMANDAVTLNTKQVISSVKTFDRVKMEKDIVTNSTVDGVRVADLGMEIVTVGDNAVVAGDKVFENIRVAEDLYVEGLVNGINVTEASEAVVLRSDNVTFHKALNVVGNVYMSRGLKVETINGLVPEKDLVLKDKRQTVAGIKTFVKDVVVRGDLNVEGKGKVNDVIVSKLAEDAIVKNVPQDIQGKKIFSSMEVKGNVTVSGEVDGVNLSKLSQSLLRIDRYQEIPGSVIFNGEVELEQSLSVEGLINKHNFGRIFEDAVMVDGTQNITGKKIFSTDIKAKYGLTLFGDITLKDSLVNDVNISMLNAEIVDVRSDQIITGIKRFARPIVFEQSINITGLLNGLSTRDLVTVNGEQVIPGKKTFITGFKLSDNAIVLGVIDGESLAHLHQDTLFFNESKLQTVLGTKNFLAGPRFQSDVNVQGLADGVNMSLVLNITLNTPQHISHPLFFANLIVNADVATNRSYAGKRLKHLWQHRITLATEQEIRGSVVFLDNLIVDNDVIVNSTVNGVDLSELDVFRAKTMLGFGRNLNNTQVRMKEQCNALAYLKRSFKSAILRLDYFDHFQTFTSIGFQHFHYFTVKSLHFLAAAVFSMNNDFCADSIIYIWSRDRKQFVKHQLLKTSGAKKFVFFQEAGSYFLAVANMKQGCGTNGPSTLYKLRLDSMKFVMYQSLESKMATDVSVFKRRNTTSLLLANSCDNQPSCTASITVWRMNATGSFFTARQTLTVSDVAAVESFSIGNRTIIAVAVNRNPLTGEAETSSYIYQTRNRYLSLSQQILTTGARHFKAFLINGINFLAVADAQNAIGTWIAADSSLVKIYKYSKRHEKFMFFQALRASGPCHIEVFQLKRQVLMSVVEEFQTAIIYEYIRGIGFEYKMVLEHHGLLSTTFFEIQNEPYLALSSVVDKQVSNEVCPMGSKILKILLSGINSAHIKTVPVAC
eukprot:gene20480-22496_t